MEKIISKLLYAILGIIIIICALIVLYGKNPTFAKFIKNTADDIPRPVFQIQEETGETEIVMESAAANSIKK